MNVWQLTNKSLSAAAGTADTEVDVLRVRDALAAAAIAVGVADGWLYPALHIAEQGTPTEAVLIRTGCCYLETCINHR